MSAAVAVCSRLLGPLYTSTKTTLLGGTVFWVGAYFIYSRGNQQYAF